MDSRIVLKNNTMLRFENGREYMVTGVQARGGSCIVYSGYYTDNVGKRKNVRIKECYPFACRLSRSEDNCLKVSESDEELFERAKEKMLRAYVLGNELFGTDGLTNYTANTYNLYQANNTVYVVYVYAQGQELSYERYPSVRDSIAVVKSVAEAIRRIHSKGFLYLDIKPGNIFTLEGTTDLIQLFDFDTLIPISSVSAEDGDEIISYTRGFAALEQQTGDFRRIGTYSDVYGIGALLFYMLFHRVPDAFDCELDAEYDFGESKLAGACFRDILPVKITEFFHGTLANYYLDRFSGMDAVIDALEEIRNLADTTTRFLFNTRILRPDLLLGRKNEKEWLANVLRGAEQGVFFVTGMGGIGKSTLVKSCIRENEDCFDHILYLNYHNSITETMTDDFSLRINGVQRDSAETEDAYYTRKMTILRDLTEGKKVLLVIDNYRGGDHFETLGMLGWKVICVTRDRALATGFPCLEVKEIPEEILLELFERRMEREMTGAERASALRIIRKMNGHTLVVELIARQIGSPVSILSVEKAEEIVNKSGYAALGEERIPFRKDEFAGAATIPGIVEELLAGSGMSTGKMNLLKIISMFGEDGISVVSLCEAMKGVNRDALNELYREGWIAIRDRVITMHPIIVEVVNNREMTPEQAENAVCIMEFLILKLQNDKEENTGEPGRFFAESSDSLMEDLLKKEIPMNVDHENSAERIDNNRILFRQMYRMAVAFLEGCRREDRLNRRDIYRQLLFFVIKNTSGENNIFIREKSEEYIRKFQVVGSSVLSDRKKEWGYDEEDPYKNHETVMLLRVYSGYLEALYRDGEIEHAGDVLEELHEIADHETDPHIIAMYYDILVGYYDEILDGYYDAGSEEEREIRNILVECSDRAIHYMKQSSSPNSGRYLAEYYSNKVMLMIRTNLGTEKEIREILGLLREQVNLYADANSSLTRNYYMLCSWYHTYYDRDPDAVHCYLKKAGKITEIIARDGLEKIDEMYSPAANICLECREFENSAGILLHCIRICEEKGEIRTYQRKEIELLGHLFEVYYMAGWYDRCRTVRKVLEDRIRSFPDIPLDSVIPEETLEELSDK